ncbi:YAH1 [Sanghuangporus sanghuang]
MLVDDCVFVLLIPDFSADVVEVLAGSGVIECECSQEEYGWRSGGRSSGCREARGGRAEEGAARFEWYVEESGSALDALFFVCLCGCTPAPGTGIKVTFKDSKGTILKTVEANEGDDILSIAHEYDIDLEGACEGSVACSTCHVILDPQSYDLLPEPSDDENDMLDMAFGLTDTSRLGCQIKVTKELDGITCTLPAATRNMYVDGAKPHH